MRDVERRIKEAKANSDTKLCTIPVVDNSLITTLSTINNQPDRLIMWDTGATFNFMHVFEAERLQLVLSPSSITGVVVGNEARLEVIGCVSASVSIREDVSALLEFKVTANLPFGVILGLQGMQLLSVIPNPLSMSLDLPNNGGSIPCSVTECPDDSV
jgi:hypothetical protein